MTETKEGAAPAAGGEQGGQGVIESQHQRDGRYIPYSGGSLGWYENSGVPAREKSNNYGFHTAIDSDMVRAKQYLRAGLRAEKRRSPRRALSEELAVTLKTGKEEKSARAFDVSRHGARVQYIGDDIVLRNSDKVLCQFLGKGGEAPVLELMCTVVRSWKVGKTRTLWNFGVDFPMLNPEQLAKLESYAGLGE